MSSICLYFHVHQPHRLRTYRFFDIGDSHYYYDEFQNRTIIKRIATRCYLPANKVLLDLIERHGKQFKVSFSLSGNAIDQIEIYAPEVIKSFKDLAKTGCVEFLAETYSHNLSSLRSPDEFKRYIEVKGRSAECGIMISENEMNRLAQLGDTAWLYMVMNCKSNPVLHRIQNPAKNLQFEIKSKGVQYFLPMEEWKNKI